MGELSKIEGARKYYNFETKNHKCMVRVQKGGVKTPVAGIEGQLTDIIRRLNKPRDGQKWRAYWSYEFVFTDYEGQEKTEYILSVPEGYRTTNSLINRLSTIEMPGVITVKAFESNKYEGSVVVYVENDGTKVPLKYFDIEEYKDNNGKTRKKLKGIPARIYTKTGVDAEGNDEYAVDDSEESKHWYKEVQGIYKVCTGRDWDEATNVKGQTQTQKPNAAEPTDSSEKLTRIIKWIEGKDKVDDILAAWETACTTQKFVPSLSDKEKREVQERCTAHVNLKADIGLTYKLILDGSAEAIEEADDDLPF